MEQAFVWFQNLSGAPAKTVEFYQQLLGWKSVDGPGGAMFAGEHGPFAGVGPRDGAGGWLPYVPVADLEAATSQALSLGGTLLKGRTKGPAGEFSVVQDPGGAVVALWQKG